jgi:hypothetical protein
MDEAGILVSIVTQEFSSLCGQPRIPLYMFGIQVTRHDDGKNLAEAGSQVRNM